MPPMDDQATSPEAVSEPPAADQELDRLLGEMAALDALAADWPSEQQMALEARLRAVDALNAAAFRRLIRALNTTPESALRLREAVQDPLVYAVLRQHGILRPSAFERVEAALETVRPMLASHGGDVELIRVEPPLVEVRFLGACDGCPASALTFYSGVKKAIQDHVPEIEDIRQVQGLGADAAGGVHYSSPFADYKNDAWQDVMALADLADGATVMRTLGTNSLLVSRFGDRVTCFENSCAHMGLAMDGGEIEDGIITCPYHGFRYALASGECLTAPEVQLQPHGVRVAGGRIEVQITR